MDSYKNLSKIYDTLIYEDINYDKMCSKIIEISKKFNIKHDNYLDLACGTGTLSCKIGKYFKTSFLVDLSDDMLMEAYEKLKKNRINGKVICQNMSELDLNHKFDLITCSLDATNYITSNHELKKYFKSVWNCLDEKGVFIFDINSYYKLSTILGNNTYSYDEDGIFYCWSNCFEEDVLYMDLVFFVKNGKCYDRFDEEHVERAYREEYIDDVLKECGFRIAMKLDNYEKEHISEKTERITYVVVKDERNDVNERCFN